MRINKAIACLVGLSIALLFVLSHRWLRGSSERPMGSTSQSLSWATDKSKDSGGKVSNWETESRLVAVLRQELDTTRKALESALAETSTCRAELQSQSRQHPAQTQCPPCPTCPACSNPSIPPARSVPGLSPPLSLSPSPSSTVTIDMSHRTELVGVPNGVEHYKPGFAPKRTSSGGTHADANESCFNLWKKYMVIPFTTYGDLPPDLWNIWASKSCNSVAHGELRKCLDPWVVHSPHPNEEGDRRKLIEISRELLDYESPFIDPWNDHKIAPLFAKLPDVALDFREAAQLKLWESLRNYKNERNQVAPFSANHMYAGLDQYMLYSLIRHFRPRRVVEIGSGQSSYTVVKALRQNRHEFKEENIHWCIEPFRAETLDKMHSENLADHTTVIEKTAQETPISVYQQLEPGDFLFIDSSHVTAPHGDTVFEMNVLLPQLPVGVIVHIHDIFLPYDYPHEWLMDTYRPYTEQYMLAAFLYGNAKWEILWSTRKWMVERPDLFHSILPSEEVDGGSFWIRKIA